LIVFHITGRITNRDDFILSGTEAQAKNM